MKYVVLAAAAAVTLAGCGTQMGDRMASGAAIGAGTGAVFGGVGALPGAVRKVQIRRHPHAGAGLDADLLLAGKRGHAVLQRRLDAPHQLRLADAVATDDAATVVLTALKNRKPGEPVKAAVARSGPYQGLQQEIVFDSNGDTIRKVYFTEIREGRYRRID